MHQGDFRGIGSPGEHAFAEKCRAQGNAVQPADQFIALPGFDAMGETALMQFGEKLLNFPVYPGRPASRRRFGAGAHDAFKGAVDANRESVLAHRPAQAAGQVKAIKRQDTALFRIDPKHLRLVPSLGHGENPGRIGFQYDIGGDLHLLPRLCRRRFAGA